MNNDDLLIVYVAAVFGIFLGSFILAVVLYYWRRHDAKRRRPPRIKSRDLPLLEGFATIYGAPEPETVQVAGRVYLIDSEPSSSGLCPWCGGSVERSDSATVVCARAFCGQMAHRDCNERQGGCGGVCRVSGA
jgi:hypothetical protein